MADKGKAVVDENIQNARMDTPGPTELSIPMKSTPTVEASPKVNIFGASWDLKNKGLMSEPGEEVSGEAASAPFSTADLAPSSSSEEERVEHSATSKSVGTTAETGSDSSGRVDLRITKEMGLSEDELYTLELRKYFTDDRKAPAQSADVSQTLGSWDTSEGEIPLTVEETANSRGAIQIFDYTGAYIATAERVPPPTQSQSEAALRAWNQQRIAAVGQTMEFFGPLIEEERLAHARALQRESDNSRVLPVSRGFKASLGTSGGSTLASTLEANRASRPGGLASATHLELAQDINQVLSANSANAGDGVQQQANEQSRRRCNCVIY